MPLSKTRGGRWGSKSSRSFFSQRKKRGGPSGFRVFFVRCTLPFSTLSRQCLRWPGFGMEGEGIVRHLFALPPPPPLGGTFGISGLDSGNYGIPCRQSRHFISLTAKVVKTFELRVKKRLFWDASAKVVIALWLRAKSSKHLGYGCRDANALPQLEWHFPPTLIVRVGGKLLCQLFFGFIWFSWYELGGFLGVEGLDRKTGVRGQGPGFRKGGAGVSAGWRKAISCRCALRALLRPTAVRKRPSDAAGLWHG